MENTQAHVDDIMDKFNFGKVVKIMQALNWTWYNNDEPPEEYELRKVARRLLKDVAKQNEPNCTIGTGGFYASKDDDDFLCLSFTAEEWCSDMVEQQEEYQ